MFLHCQGVVGIGDQHGPQKTSNERHQERPRRAAPRRPQKGEAFVSTKPDNRHPGTFTGMTPPLHTDGLPEWVDETEQDPAILAVRRPFAVRLGGGGHSRK